MAKQLKFSDEARQSLLRGISSVAQAVITTLGPKGRNVALDKKWGAPTVVHDGVTVAKEIELEDPYENMGAQLVPAAVGPRRRLQGIEHFRFAETFTHGHGSLPRIRRCAATSTAAVGP